MPAHNYLRFLPPLILSVVGLLVAIWIVDFMAVGLIYRDPTAADSTLVVFVPGTLLEEIRWLLTFTSAITFAVYLVMGIPLSCILVVLTKIVRVTSYDIDIVRIGQDFGATRMLRRAAMPALFSLSLSGVLSGLITDLVVTPIDVNPAAKPFYFPLESVAVTLFFLPIVLAFFIPTWMLDDAGVVMHLKEKHLESRRCPDTEGVGRWWSNLQSGFTVIAVPIVTFFQNFYRPLVSGDILGAPFLFRGLLVSVGIPFIAIAFILPVIVLNEIFVGTVSNAVRRIVKNLGARNLEFEMKLTQVAAGEHGDTEAGSSRKGESSNAYSASMSAR